MNVTPACVRLEAWFEGHVQGVGFRYHTCKIAREFEVTGLVENLDDGRVHLIAEGAPAQTDGFLAEIHNELGHFVKRVNSDVRPLFKPEHRGFSLR